MLKTISKNTLFFVSLAFLLFPTHPLDAWNEDYRPENIPLQRTVCVHNLSGLSQGTNTSFRSVQPDEPCASNETRYTLVIGTNPKGSLALVSQSLYNNFYPPWVVSWPANEDLMSPRLWHFTCFANSDYEVLGTVLKKHHFRGEITSPTDRQSCEAASTMANTVCRENLGGNEVMEQCFGSLGVFEQ